MSKAKFQFTKSDIKDQLLLEKMINDEVSSIMSTEEARRGRSKSQIRDSVIQGKTLEAFLVQTGKYKLSDNRYHDLINKDGEYVEVKAYAVYDSNAPYVKKDLERIRTGTWNKSKWYLLFQYKAGVYTFLEKIEI